MLWFVISIIIITNLDDYGFTLGARPVAAHAMDAAGGLKVLLVTEIDEGVEIVHADEFDIASATAVAAVGAAELDEFFTAETDAAVTAITALDVDFGLVQEFHRLGLCCGSARCS